MLRLRTATSWALGAVVLTASIACRAEERPHRNIVDVELFTIHAPVVRTDDSGLNSMMLVGYERVLGPRRGYVSAVVGGAVGFMEVQGRAGVLLDVIPDASHGPIARLELRPTMAILTGAALFGALGLGYRLPAGGFILPIVEGGPVQVSQSCPVADASGRAGPCVPSHWNVYLGGTLSFGARF